MPADQDLFSTVTKVLAGAVSLGDICTKSALMSNHQYAPETQMLGYGYKPELSEGAVKCPVFQTSTFVFRSAEEGKAFFEMAHGKGNHAGKEMGLIYSRINNPDMEVLEERLRLWDGGEMAAAFSSGMSAIATSLLTYLRPGDLLLYSNPLYGGTHKFIHQVLTSFGVEIVGFNAGESRELIHARLETSGHAHRLRMIYVETPANPTNDLIDIALCRALADQYSTEGQRVLVTVDNTYMGPLWQHPLKHGADIVLYSATKYIGGHSDVIAGAVVGAKSVIMPVKKMRTVMGTMLDPHSCWLLMRSLETLKIRMETAARNAELVAAFLLQHPKVEKVYYLGFTNFNHPDQERIFRNQYESKGAMLSFDVAGGEHEAFTFLNTLKHIKLAVSLGGTESLAEHPATMTHADVPVEEKQQYGITSQMVRLSIGIEHPDDLIADIAQALDAVRVPSTHAEKPVPSAALV
jgi:methionine-gamma-lyase